MTLLIDGYNFLHASDVFPADDVPGTLANARESLVEFLARVLPEKVRARTVLVFDARQAPPGLPKELRRHGLTLLFAPRHQSADELLAELIDREPAPRGLTVVSSDHGVQRAARRRGATYVDSEVWRRELQTLARAAEGAPEESHREKPEGLATPEDVRFWVDEFLGDDERR